MYAVVDACSCGLQNANNDVFKMVEIGKRIKWAYRSSLYTCIEGNCDIKGVPIFCWSHPLESGADGIESGVDTFVSPPGRLDRCRCEKETSACMAILHARRQVKIGRTFRHESIVETEFTNLRYNQGWRV